MTALSRADPVRLADHQHSRSISLPRQSYAAFGISAVLVVLICRTIIMAPLFLQSPELGFWGVTFDLCVTIPVLFILLVVRRGHSSLATVAPVFILCTAMAHAIVPDGQRALLQRYATLAVLLEIGVLAYLIHALRKGWRSGRGQIDPMLRIRMMCEQIVGRGIAAEAIAAELWLMYYGGAGWRLPSAPVEPEATTFHRRAGWGSIVGCIIVLIAAEGIAVHLFVQQWSHLWAWAFTALDIYSVVWLIGDYHAFRTRPTEVIENALHLRFGLRWSAVIPVSAIAVVEPISAAAAEAMRGDRSFLRLSMLDEPEWLIRLREPVVVTGLMGWRRTVSHIGIRPDHSEFVGVLSRAVAG